MDPIEKEKRRWKRRRRVRKKVSGTPERPRLSVYRSHLNLYAQLIDDATGRTLVSASTLQPEFKKIYPKGGDVEAARRLGEHLAGLALAAGITQVVFDRGGYPYHGRIKALAEAAREKGLQF